MTTATESQALRAIVVVPETADTQKQASCRLLRELGHDLRTARSTNEWVGMLESSPADLLVIDLASDADRRAVVDKLSTLPVGRRPRHVVAFADGLDEYVRNLQRSLDRPKVHVFLKPLHVHGLLSVIRSTEGRLQQSA